MKNYAHACEWECSPSLFLKSKSHPRLVYGVNGIRHLPALEDGNDVPHVRRCGQFCRIIIDERWLYISCEHDTFDMSFSVPHTLVDQTALPSGPRPTCDPHPVCRL